ncbi:ABC transporter permease [Actinoplanes derwentensis]|uniref:Peptide/nickel transport system permease protein n=1 Tax=Actinoplanes derwentensis TaxID=113562 RepID=A0A1H1VR64_9ACTN|nr:ABC transporter permease [Actinoplanes derwentensis]GID83629.1 ABC transporter permease [Actinoplanes derwentensis]SDS86736.1 peptide/nickel transport system permease protein [Actinoplanes derwentensis]
MTVLLLRRLPLLPFGLLAASVLVFALPRLTGADTVRTVLRARTASAVPDPATEARVAAEFGLDGSVVEQYLRWLGAAVRGDFGLSFVTRTPVGPQVGEALLVSATITVVALVVALLVGVPAGVYAARRPNVLLDRIVTGAGIVGVSVPEFVLAPLLVLALSVRAGLLPAIGWGTPAHLALPVLTLAVYPAALTAQLVRAETVTALQRPHVLIARAKGLPAGPVLWRHGARLATTSVLSLTGMFVAGLIGGSVVVEVVFGIPGLGRLLYDAVLAQDLPIVQAGTLAVIAVALVAGALSEVAQLALDPVARQHTADR